MTEKQKFCPLMEWVACQGDACAWWEEMSGMCSVKAQQRHIRAWSMGLTELGMALVDVLKAIRAEKESE